MVVKKTHFQRSTSSIPLPVAGIIKRHFHMASVAVWWLLPDREVLGSIPTASSKSLETHMYSVSVHSSKNKFELQNCQLQEPNNQGQLLDKAYSVAGPSYWSSQKARSGVQIPAGFLKIRHCFCNN